MLGKSLRYHRLKSNLFKRQLAAMTHSTVRWITCYEQDTRIPSMETIEALAAALHVQISDFLAVWDETLVFTHGPFRRGDRLTRRQQDYIRDTIEEHMSRFHQILSILGGALLPEAPACHALPLSPSGDAEEDAKALRHSLFLPVEGPVGNLIARLEDMGILVCLLPLGYSAFSEMRGLVNGRHYIALRDNLPPEHMRSSLARALSQLRFAWPDSLTDSAIEERADAISSAFLFPREDVERVLGRGMGMGQHTISPQDMERICQEYGISLALLELRAAQCGIAPDHVPKALDRTRSEERGWNRNEPAQIPREEPLLFSQLVCRAVREHEISIQKGAEPLQQSHQTVESHCFGG